MLRGIARYDDGKPAAGAWMLVCAAQGSDRKERRFVRCDARGAFVVRDWPAGDWKLHVYPGGLARVALAPRETREVDIDVLDYPVVRGHVFAYGKPLVGAEIHTGRIEGEVTGEDGGYEFSLCSDPPCGDMVCVHPPDVAMTTRMVSATRWGEVITLDFDLGSIRLSGIVRDARTGQPIEQASVSIESESSMWGSRSDTDQDGKWLIGPVLPGHYRMKARAGWYATLERELDVSDGHSIEDFDLQLSPER